MVDPQHPYNFPPNLSIAPSRPPPATTTSNPPSPSSDDWQQEAISTYGIAGRVWEAAYHLALYLAPPTSERTFDPPCSLFPVAGPSSPWTIIELGAGTGHTSLTLAPLLTPNDTLVMTDLEEIVPLMRTRLAAASPNGDGAKVEVRALPWADKPAVSSLFASLPGPVTHVLCSDLVYFPVLYPPLVATLLALTDGEVEVEVVIAYKTRDLYKESPFWEMLGGEFVIEPVCVGVGSGKARFGKEEGVGVMLARRKRGMSEGGEEREVGFEDLVMLGMGEGVFD